MTDPSGRAPRGRCPLFAVAGGAVLLLAAASTVTVAAASGAFDSQGRNSPRRGPACAAPVLPGTTVSVRLVEMPAMMNRGSVMGGSGGRLRQRDWRYFHRGMMRVLVSATSVTAGVVSLAVTNTGYLTHELVVLPLAGRQQPGTRAVGRDGKVDETHGLGEASAACAGGAGNGITPGSTGWVSLHLPPGRYELTCNLPGHYAAGMYAELDVT